MRNSLIKDDIQELNNALNLDNDINFIDKISEWVKDLLSTNTLDTVETMSVLNIIDQPLLNCFTTTQHQLIYQYIGHLLKDYGERTNFVSCIAEMHKLDKENGVNSEETYTKLYYVYKVILSSLLEDRLTFSSKEYLLSNYIKNIPYTFKRNTMQNIITLVDCGIYPLTVTKLKKIDQDENLVRNLEYFQEQDYPKKFLNKQSLIAKTILNSNFLGDLLRVYEKSNHLFTLTLTLSADNLTRSLGDYRKIRLRKGVLNSFTPMYYLKGFVLENPDYLIDVYYEVVNKVIETTYQSPPSIHDFDYEKFQGYLTDSPPIKEFYLKYNQFLFKTLDIYKSPTTPTDNPINIFDLFKSANLDIYNTFKLALKIKLYDNNNVLERPYPEELMKDFNSLSICGVFTRVLNKSFYTAFSDYIYQVIIASLDNDLQFINHLDIDVDVLKEVIREYCIKFYKTHSKQPCNINDSYASTDTQLILSEHLGYTEISYTTEPLAPNNEIKILVPKEVANLIKYLRSPNFQMHLAIDTYVKLA